MSWDPEPSLDAFAQVWHGWHQEHVAGTKVEFAIRLKETGEYLGTAGLHEIEAVEPETGIWIKEVCQGHGFGFEALSTVIAFAARDLGKETLTYHVAEKNVASCRLAENLGGEIVGRKVLEKSDGTKFSGLIYRLSASAVEHRSRRKC